MNAQVFQGDALHLAESLASDSIDAVITDPPYGLKFMGKEWDHGVPGQPFWEEFLRTMKPGAHLLAFGGTRTHHRLMVAIEDAGFDIRDCLMWLYGNGMPKGRNLKGDWDGWGTTLKPGWEPIIMARKPLGFSVDQNVTTHGTGAINVDGCRLDGIPPSVPQPSFKSPTGQVYGFQTGVGRTGGMSQSDKGRWPANVILDEDAAAMLDQVSGASKSTKGKPRKSEVPGDGYGMTHTGSEYDDAGGASRFFYTAKASRKERGEGNNHPTVKPIALMRWLCRLATPPGGTILDPFNGSGSTGCAAVLEGFRYLGFELDQDFVDISEQRIAHWSGVSEPFSYDPDAPLKLA